MDNNIIASLKMIYKPLIMYYGEWDFLPGLKHIALELRKKNLYADFIDKYYYKPLMVIFKDEDIVNSFRYGICSRIGAKGRELYFSKKVFLSNIIPNVFTRIFQHINFAAVGNIVYIIFRTAIY